MNSVRNATIQMSEFKISTDDYKNVISSSKASFNGDISNVDSLAAPAKYLAEQAKFRQALVIASQSMDEDAKLFQTRQRI